MLKLSDCSRFRKAEPHRAVVVKNNSIRGHIQYQPHKFVVFMCLCWENGWTLLPWFCADVDRVWCEWKKINEWKETWNISVRKKVHSCVYCLPGDLYHVFHHCCKRASYRQEQAIMYNSWYKETMHQYFSLFCGGTNYWSAESLSVLKQWLKFLLIT